MQNEQQYLTYDYLVAAATPQRRSTIAGEQRAQIDSQLCFPLPGKDRDVKANPYGPWKTLMEQPGGTIKIINQSGVDHGSVSINCTFEELAKRLRPTGTSYVSPGQSDRSVGFSDVILLTPECPRAYREQLRILAECTK